MSSSACITSSMVELPSRNPGSYILISVHHIFHGEVVGPAFASPALARRLPPPATHRARAPAPVRRRPPEPRPTTGSKQSDHRWFRVRPSCSRAGPELSQCRGLKVAGREAGAPGAAPVTAPRQELRVDPCDSPATMPAMVYGADLSLSRWTEAL